MSNMKEIEQLTREYAMARAVLRERVEALEAEVTALKRRRLPGIKTAVATASERQALLRDAVEESPELFVKPRTCIWHGIRVGYKKEKGKLKWEDEARVVTLIKKGYPEEWNVYIKVTEKPLKISLEQLPAVELKKLGIRVSEDTDEVYIKSTDSEIDRLVNQLLSSTEAEIQRETASE